MSDQKTTTPAGTPATQPAAQPARQGLITLRGTGAVANARTAAADAIITRGGKINRVGAMVTLRMSEGHIYSIDDGETWMIQADGFFACNQVMGLQFVLPATVPVEGTDQPNPYVMRTPEGRITGIYVRGALVGRDLTGTHRVVMETLFLDPEAWFRLGMLKAVEFNDRGGDHGWGDAGYLCARDMLPGQDEREDGNFVIYPIDEEVCCVLDLRNYKVRKLLETRTGVMRDFTKRAMTVLQRRLFRAHPGSPGQRIPRGAVRVTREERQRGWGDRARTVNEIVEAEYDVAVMGWVDDSPLSAALADAVRRGESKLADCIVDDLGQTDTQGAMEEPAPPAKAAAQDPVERATSQKVDAPPASAETTPAGATLASAAEAKAMISSLRKMRGGSTRATAIVAEVLGSEKTIDDLTQVEVDRLTALCMAAANEVSRGAAAKGGDA